MFEQDWHFAAKEDLPARRARKEEPRACRRRSTPSAATPSSRSSGAAPTSRAPSARPSTRVFFSAITIAREKVYITTPYFIPDRAILVALQTAALRGVDVRLLLPSKSNHPVVFQAARFFYEELLEAGVRIYGSGPGIIHAKTMVVDTAVALVGSANMDLRSFRLNFEVHARDPRRRGRPRARRDLRGRPRPLERNRDGHLQAPPRMLRVVEGVARFLSPLM